MPEVTESDTLESIREDAQAAAGAMDNLDESMMDGSDTQSLDGQQDDMSPGQPSHMLLQTQQQIQQPMAHEALLPLIQATATMASQDPILHIDPAMQNQPPRGTSQTASIPMPSMQSSMTTQTGLSDGSLSFEHEQRDAMMQRYRQLQQEMDAIRNVMSSMQQ